MQLEIHLTDGSVILEGKGNSWLDIKNKIKLSKQRIKKLVLKKNSEFSISTIENSPIYFYLKRVRAILNGDSEPRIEYGIGHESDGKLFTQWLEDIEEKRPRVAWELRDLKNDDIGIYING